MKKYRVNDEWEFETYDDHSDVFLLVVEQNLPACSYVHKSHTDPTELQNLYKKCKSIGTILKNKVKHLNQVVYSEQNTEELNSVKDFVQSKLEVITNLKNFIYKDIKNIKNGKEQLYFNQIGENLSKYRNLCDNKYLTHLENLYTRAEDVEFSL